MSKPEYAVPSMAEIEAIPHNGVNVVSTFSGAGGSCLGYRMAGCRVLWASEFVPAAQEVYKLNHPNSILDLRDIREVRPNEILENIDLGVGDIDIFDGSPPCKDFSTAGKRAEKWGKESTYTRGSVQRVDDLFFEYVRLLEGLRPKTFIAENVTGLVRGVAKGYFLLIRDALKAAGYRVLSKVLDAQWLGVPTARRRMIFMGVRDDLPCAPVLPKPFPYRYNVSEILPHIKQIKFGPQDWRNSHRPNPTIVAMGGRTSPNAQFSGGSFVRDVSGKMRRYTIPEIKKLSGFPSDFQLIGDVNTASGLDLQWERIGRAVPPLMMRAIARTVCEEVFRA